MKLSDELADIVGEKEASHAQCVKQLWAYIKKHNLQDPANKQFFTPDKKMAKVFGSERIKAFGMAKYLKEQFCWGKYSASEVQTVASLAVADHSDNP